MAFPASKTGLFLGVFLLSLIFASQAEPKEPRLSIFNIIKFENSACVGGTRNGTCFTSAECESSGGEKDGDCADGFGVCCVIIVASGGSTSLNQSFIVQASSSAATVGSKSYQICPTSNDIRRIRLDFTIFTLAPPNTGGAVAGTQANGGPTGFLGGAIGDCTQDTFVMTSSGGASSPVICGINTGQHMIVDNDGSGCSHVNIHIGSGTFTRAYDIRVTQYREGEEAGGPQGCLQYFDQAQNMIRSFNFPVTARGAAFADTVVHLSNQDYQVCIRRAAGMFQICYIACTTSVAAISVTMAQTSFGLSLANGAAADAQIDSQCSTDYITIPNGQAIQAAANPAAVLGAADRFCGRILETVQAMTEIAMNAVSVCSTAIPFRLGVHTDDDETVANNAAENTSEQHGFPGGILGFQLCYNQS